MTTSLDTYRDHARQLADLGPAGLRTLRRRAAERFAALGFPTVRHEDWKYTNLAPLAAQSFALPNGTPAADAAALAAAARLGVGTELVFVNGLFAADLSSRPALPTGVIATNLAAALTEHPALVGSHLGTSAALEEDGLTALNTACIRDGAFLYVPEGVELDAPVHCLFLAVPGATPSVVHVRNLIVAGAGSRATLIEQYAGDGATAHWTNAVSELVIAPGAALAHQRVQRESLRTFHTGVVAAAQAADSQLVSHAVSLGAGLARTAIATRLDAPGAACVFDGLYLADGAQHVDHHTTIDHRRPRGTSRELYKGILDGRATGVFNGKVFVRPDAQQSDAQQMNKNLLLSDDAQIDTKPQLEILADDVKCSHGATIGQLDEQAIFYLRARGIDAPAARQMLIRAFANELVDRIAVAPLRERLAAEIATRFPGEAA
ncbi:MAG: Fe-S cluster assembly protein SufD [Candidatus Binatia bacterium]